MKKTIILIMSLFLLALLKSNAQVSFAPKVGFNLANLTGDTEDNEVRLRTQIGFILNTDVNEMVSFQSGLNYSGKGVTLDWGDGDKDAITLTYLEVPVNFVLNFELGSGKFQIYAGSYFSFCLGGNIKYLSDEDDEIESLDIGTSEDDDIKPLDLGINIGLGYKFKDFQIQGGYTGSFTNISNYGDDELRNSVISLTFAYFINL